ncbi:type II toxin-antitoxin system RelE/ParE family toxin [Algoriphagus antarcticus]|uniref:ParE-like toxin of type II ParDE toxin-antitoxin system n=1 Tax=Algoriphagus antarcticus TaxID=238540 RepID=A0A3E0DMK5_9BACT|nr:type II toxin-antitoxin system RelE/ParE family toxin [Algoriphagus antarcticus]REG83358.1 ParE-like toxin of type II ParDE toxin-antitoxin system [Algoriphagus antarcticus]
MKLVYELSKLAINDLESIWNYTPEKWSVEQANSYYRLIFEIIDSICIDPQIGKSIMVVKKNRSN